MKLSTWIVALSIAALLACNSTTSKGLNTHLVELQNLRNQKDSQMRADSTSPLFKDTGFRKLNYFELSQDWIIKCKTTLVTDTQIVILDTKGYLRDYQVYCKIEGTAPTGNFLLYGFKRQTDMIIFIPFTDSTCGKGISYHGGRFLETTMPDANGNLILDFNQAYNPYCHYNVQYSCPVVPEKNKLKIEILAGEKAYKQTK